MFCFYRIVEKERTMNANANGIGATDNSDAPLTNDNAMGRVLARYWPAIRTKHRGMRVLDTLNIRLIDDDALEVDLRASEACGIV